MVGTKYIGKKIMHFYPTFFALIMLITHLAKPVLIRRLCDTIHTLKWLEWVASIANSLK